MLLRARALWRGSPLWLTARVWERIWDLVLIATLVVVGLRFIVGSADALELAGTCAGVAIATVRRRAPRAVLVLLMLASVILPWWHPSSPVGLWVTTQVALFAVSLRCERRWSLTVAALLCVGLYLVTVGVYGPAPLDPMSLAVLLWTVAVAGAAMTLRAQHETVQALTERTAAVLAARDSEIEQHLSAERLRIAQDLHDSVAHTISGISLQAGAAERALTQRPQDAAAALAAIRTASRESLVELQQILGVLRDQDPAASAPAPALASLLVETSKEGGAVTVAPDLELSALPAATAVALVRIAQEAVTNARRHGTGPVSVELSTVGDDVVLQVSNTIAAPPSGTGAQRGDVISGGFGLMGMHERATVLGGTLIAGPSGRTFRVQAVLPLRAASTVRP
ncbi:sensor histidine kinase [Kineococcus radiotolerans]|uniref:histidine kinase n=1 Tax=Kineococcus radiotolerans (strain ATCC BAA-149 / DSM 14245 / SRS30216) TaxID=266940 RepID=A6WB24_KINRD|nr:histidine kinase [Kineococcus radiotolerans]ABS04013.1 integral membrane sensor signal transduction histidine kinase [Kineococcus radiotolerans SRS30216 = ATCC BAA-149]